MRMLMLLYRDGEHSSQEVLRSLTFCRRSRWAHSSQEALLSHILWELLVSTLISGGSTQPNILQEVQVSALISGGSTQPHLVRGPGQHSHFRSFYICSLISCRTLRWVHSSQEVLSTSHPAGGPMGTSLPRSRDKLALFSMWHGYAAPRPLPWLERFAPISVADLSTPGCSHNHTYKFSYSHHMRPKLFYTYTTLRAHNTLHTYTYELWFLSSFFFTVTRQTGWPWPLMSGTFKVSTLISGGYSQPNILQEI